MTAEQKQALAALAQAAKEFRDASQAMHVVHGSTDVHGHGGIAGAAMTPHCAWQCNVLVETADGYQSCHTTSRARLASADAVLLAQLAEVGL